MICSAFAWKKLRFDGKRATESMSAGTHTEALYIRSISSWDTDWIWCNPGFCSSNAINCQSDLLIQNQIWWAPFIIKTLWEMSTRNLSFSIFSPFSTLICGSTTTWTFEILWLTSTAHWSAWPPTYTGRKAINKKGVIRSC